MDVVNFGFVVVGEIRNFDVVARFGFFVNVKLVLAVFDVQFSQSDLSIGCNRIEISEFCADDEFFEVLKVVEGLLADFRNSVRNGEFDNRSATFERSASDDGGNLRRRFAPVYGRKVFVISESACADRFEHAALGKNERC